MKSLFDTFRAVMMSNPSGSRKELQDEFISRMIDDPDNFAALATDYFERMAAVWTVHADNPASTSFGRTGVSQDKVARMVRRDTAEARQRTMKAVAALRDTVLLDLVMPNGKLLRDASGADCAKAGGFYAEIAKHLKPTQIVDRHLKEGDLQNIRARFYQVNKEKVA